MVQASGAYSIPPLLLRNILTSIFIYADKLLLILGERYKILQFIRCFLISAFVFFLSVLPSFFPSLSPTSAKENPNANSNFNFNYCVNSPSKAAAKEVLPPFAGGGSGESCIARALSQLLLIINEIPASSRKYEMVRSFAEKLLNENLHEGYEPLRMVNTKVLAAAFSRTLRQLEAAAMDQECDYGGGGGLSGVEGGGGRVRSKSGGYLGLNRVFRTVGYYGDAAWNRFGIRPSGRLLRSSGSSAEKLSAELLWLAQKLTACGSAAEAVSLWASASKLALLGLSVQPRLQGSLVKVSAFLFKQAREMGGKECEESKVEEQRQTKMKLLMSWLPFLCRASVGTDAPVLSFTEKAELERVLGEIIESLKHEEEQEKVLSLWLHHFTHCPSSDWPNLHSCYARWCTVSRKILIHKG